MKQDGTRSLADRVAAQGDPDGLYAWTAQGFDGEGKPVFVHGPLLTDASTVPPLEVPEYGYCPRCGGAWHNFNGECFC